MVSSVHLFKLLCVTTANGLLATFVTKMRPTKNVSLWFQNLRSNSSKYGADICPCGDVSFSIYSIICGTNHRECSLVPRPYFYIKVTGAKNRVW